MKNDSQPVTTHCPQCGQYVSGPSKLYANRVWHPRCLDAYNSEVNYDRAANPDGV